MQEIIKDRLESLKKSFIASENKIAILGQRIKDMEKELQKEEAVINQTRGAFQVLNDLLNTEWNIEQGPHV